MSILFVVLVAFFIAATCAKILFEFDRTGPFFALCTVLTIAVFVSSIKAANKNKKPHPEQEQIHRIPPHSEPNIKIQPNPEPNIKILPHPEPKPNIKSKSPPHSPPQPEQHPEPNTEEQRKLRIEKAMANADVEFMSAPLLDQLRAILSDNYASRRFLHDPEMREVYKQRQRENPWWLPRRETSRTAGA